MPGMTHREHLEKSIERLQAERAIFQGKIMRLSQAQLDFKPSSLSWSIGQIAHHVALGEGVWQGYLRGILRDGLRENGITRRVSLQEVPFSSRVVPDFILKSPFVITPLSLFMSFLPRPVQSMLFAVPIFKLNAGPRMQPKLGQSRSYVITFLESTRKITVDLVKPHADKDLSRFRIIHPLVGDQDIYGVLELLASHEQRHSLQIDSIQKAPGFPGPEV
jgi:hypothetical protein